MSAEGRAPAAEMKSFNSRRPPKPTPDEIADYAWAELTCRDCGSEPHSACIGPREPWRSVCLGRYVEASIQLRNARNAKHPSWETLESLACAELAEERGGFMGEVPQQDVTGRVRQWVAEGRY